MLETLKEIFMILFVSAGIVAITLLLYAMIAGFIKSIIDEKRRKKDLEEINKAIDEFAEEFIKELEKEENAKKTKKTTKKTNN